MTATASLSPSLPVETLVAPRPAVVVSSRPTAVPPLPTIAVLPERIPLVIGIWIEPTSDPGHAAHLDPVSTLLEQLRRDFPATPFRLLVPPLVAQAGWLRQVATKAGCPVSPAAEVEPGRPVLETLARRSDFLICLSPSPEQSPETKDLIRWKREGRIDRTEGESERIAAGPVEYWDLSRGGRARRQHLAVSAKGSGFASLAHHVRTFNQRTSKLGSVLTEAMARERETLVTEETLVRLTPGQNATLERFAANAAIAAHFRPLARGARIAWMTLAGLTAAAFVMAEHTTAPAWTSLHTISLEAALGLLVLALGAGGLRARWRSFFVHHGALAETMRIHLVRCLAGLPSPKAGQIPPNDSESPRWLRTAVGSWTTGLAQTEPVSPASLDRMRLLQERWVRARRDELTQRAAHAEKNRARFRQLTRALGGLAGLFTAGLVARATGGWAEFPQLPFEVGAVLALALASVCSQAASRLAQEAQRNRRESRIFAQAAEALNGDLPSSARLIDSLAEETLRESADWVINEKERGLTPVFR